MPWCSEDARFGRRGRAGAAPSVAGMDIPMIAGTASTVVFAVSNLPMLRKALQTRDVSSYSLSSIVMINAANVVYSLYVFSLPVGPIWALHTFYLVSCAIMLSVRRAFIGGAHRRGERARRSRLVRTLRLRRGPHRRDGGGHPCGHEPTLQPECLAAADG